MQSRSRSALSQRWRCNRQRVTPPTYHQNRAALFWAFRISEGKREMHLRSFALDRTLSHVARTPIALMFIS